MESPKRKHVRLQGYDYSKNGMYFITVCVKDRHDMLGRVNVGDVAPDVPICGAPDVPDIQLSEYGVIVENYIRLINDTYNNIVVDKYVIMPNHIHMIIIINGQETGTSGATSPTNATIPFLVSTFKRFTNKEFGFPMWQRSYHDHIIRNEQDYREIWKYIDENPLRYDDD